MEDLKSNNNVEAAGVPQLLDLAIAMAGRRRPLRPNTPFALLEDLFDAQVVSSAERLFALVEQRGDALMPLLADPKSGMRAKLTFLRMCTDLARRFLKVEEHQLLRPHPDVHGVRSRSRSAAAST